MADHEIVALNEGQSRVEAPQTGDRYLLARDLNANGKAITGAGAIDSTGFTGPHTELTNHLNDATDAHDAEAISFDNAGTGMTAANTQDAIEELKGLTGTIQTAATIDANNLSAHLIDTAGAHAASAISFDNGPSTLSAITVQAALDELDAEKLNSAGVSVYGATLIDDTTAAAARRTLNAETDRFWYKTNPNTPIFVVVQGQSNPDNLETASTPFPVEPLVKSYESITPLGSPGTQATTPGAAFALSTPDPSLTATTEGNAIGPYVGYRRGNRGSIGCSLCVELARYYNRPVILLNLCFSGAEFEYWMEKDVPTSANTMNELLGSFVSYMLANLPELADVDFPDIVVHGQSESNAGAKAAPYILTPLEYKTKFDTFRNATFGVWTSEEYTEWLLVEPTQYVNWTGTGGGGGGTLAYPWKWEGLHAVDRYTDERVTLVSSIGIPWNTAASGNFGSAAYVHFSGDGCNEYGRRLAHVYIGKTKPSRVHNTEIERDKTPKLGGNLNADTKNISSVGNLSATSATINTLTLGGNAVGGGFSWAGLNDIDAASATIDALINPVVSSNVANAPTAVAHIINTENTLDATGVVFPAVGPKILSIQNNDVEKAWFGWGGRFVCDGFDSNLYGLGAYSVFSYGISLAGDFSTAAGTYQSTNTTVAHDFKSSTTLSGTQKLLRVNNNATEKASIQQDGFLKVMGGFGANYRTATAATSWTTADHTIHFTSGTGDLTMPDITAAMTGAILLVINTRGTSVTLTPHASDAFSDGASVPNGSTWMYVCNGVSTWQRVNL